ncbi:DegV family protein [Paenibacillus sp. FSL R5-0887]|uniref:Fatty acid-binding protein DegV n=1 Tax=Paenibacillus odorifer TaxID=189426 RepID=A0A1R0XFE0_9BACL|nr:MULTISPECIES: DegV family protein [Paenibacillus]AWV33215.1 fatty acid-binding protein DegV [Paenibacillus odorifer]MDH6442751.1 DegV family protein with EDD domain [Paenibacillus sp. PastF-4]OMC78321.1 fatty acid-binding protein DegV [Paenibacillus odorifer]OMD33791.1 fatty acid-binding protein DegV [Paenibacillus odorifer]OMD57866.1 fatty acid-binding protein DegV [Paenibacillus odorifer]
MKSIAWVTDSTCTIDPEFAKNNHVYIVPLRLIINNECYKENIDITIDEFYEKMRQHDQVGSSQPPIGEFIELYERLKEEYDEIIAVHLSTGLSGTYNASMQGAEIAEANVIGIDSKVGAYPIREMITRGIHWHKMGFTGLEIKEKIENIIQNMSFYLIPASLSQLHRSGRVSGTQVILSQLLRINLLLRFDEGKVIVVEKIRTMKKTKQALLDIFKQDAGLVSDVCIMHSNNLEMALKLEEDIKEMAPDLRTEIMTYIPAVAVHAGEGTVGLSWIKNNRINSIYSEVEPVAVLV